MSIYKLFAMGRTSLTEILIAKGYGVNQGTCIGCGKSLKRYPAYTDKLCLVCLDTSLEQKHIVKGYSR